MKQSVKEVLLPIKSYMENITVVITNWDRAIEGDQDKT